MLILASELARTPAWNISQLPVVGCAPEWMSEKAVSIGNYVVSTGLDTYLGVDPYVSGSSEICDLLCGEDGINKWVEAKYIVEKDIDKMGDMMIALHRREARCSGHLTYETSYHRQGRCRKNHPCLHPGPALCRRRTHCPCPPT